MLRKFIVVFFLFGFVSLTPAKNYGNPSAPKGGTLTVAIEAYPKSLHNYIASEDMVLGINEYVQDSLVAMDPETYEVIPWLAKSWKISKDKLTFTFQLEPKVQFTDGTALTAEDIKFTWDLIMDPKSQTAPIQSIFSSFEGLKVIDPTTIEIKAKTNDYRNLEKLSYLFVLPKHIYSKGDFNRDFHEKLIGSGPYLLEEAKKGERIVLKRNPNYWGLALPVNKGRYNFDKIILKVVTDEVVKFELIKKGDIDYARIVMAKTWTTETSGPPFENGYLKKLKGESKVPGSMAGIAWNTRKPLFQDARVRQALSLLLNREKLIKEMFYNNYVMSAGIVAVNSEYHSPKIKPFLFDPKKAQDLLKEAGWKEISDDGLLIKDGKRFEFDLIVNNPMYQKFMTGYLEDLRKVGIKMNLRLMEWATSLKIREENQFDGFLIAYTRDVNPGSFEQMWGSSQADIKGSTNFCGYKNPEVDKLAKEIDLTYDKKKRIGLVQKLDELLAKEHLWTYFWELPYFRVVHWNRFSYPKGKAYSQYSTWRNAFDYWWADDEKEKKLKAAREKNEKVSF